MGTDRPIPTKCWEKFLAARGYHLERTSSSHDQWVKDGYRTIPVWGNKKEIPFFHIKTSCRSIGCNVHQVHEWIQKNC